MFLNVRKTAIAVALLALAGCSHQPSGPVSPNVMVGKPYEVAGVTYTPAAEPGYDKVGDGSWYGPGFNGKRTASGEIFNQNDLTAAHPTLPMPSLVRVTNLKNGKSVIVRINDRGPFKDNRIIDLSKKSAFTIGLLSTMPVRVQYLEKETEEYLASVRAGQPVDMKEYNERVDAAGGASVPVIEEAKSPPPPKPQPAQIVETTSADASTAYGEQGISGGAPLGTIVSKDLAGSAPAPAKARAAAAPQTKDWASDAVTLPEPPQPRGIEAARDGLKTPDSLKPTKTAAVAPEDSGTVQNLAAKPHEKPAVKAPAAAAAPAKGGQYTILAGSFSSEANASKLSEKLSGVSSIKVPVTMDKVVVDGKTWWRVHAGPFKNHDDAQRVLDIVKSSRAPDARIVQK